MERSKDFKQPDKKKLVHGLENLLKDIIQILNSWGGDPKQDLTPMSKSRHKDLHKDMNNYLKEQKDMNGNHMRPQKGNSGKDIQRNFDRQQRIDVLKGFYNKYPLKYWDPKLDFYRNNKMMKQWRPW